MLAIDSESLDVSLRVKLMPQFRLRWPGFQFTVEYVAFRDSNDIILDNMEFVDTP